MEKTKKPNKGTIKWIISVAKPVIPLIAVITVLSVALACFGTLLAFVSKEVIDVATGEAQGSFKEQILLLIGVVGVQIILNAILSALNVRATGKLLIALKNHLFSQILKKDWQTVTSYHSGELLNRLNNDTNVIMQAVINIVPALLSLVARIAVSLGYLFVIDRSFALLMLVVGPVILVCARIYSKKMKIYHKKYQDANGKTISFMQETIQNLLMVKSFSREDYMQQRGSFLQNVAYKINLRRNRISIVANTGLFVLFYTSYYLALAWGAFRLSTGAITYGTMMAFLQLIRQIQTAFMNLSNLLPQYYAMIASAERLIEIENLENEKELEKNIDIKQLYNSLECINAENISFAYNEEEIFKNASVSLKKGEFLAIAGTSGIGKSTLLKLFLGIIHPDEGRVVFKTSEGKEYEADKSVRKLFSYVPQGNMILSGSIRDNIVFGGKEATDDEIIECAKLAEIWDFIESLENGLDTVIGERGLGLSEGQVQRLAIARALLCDSPVILLDEATSALDETTEAAVLKNLKELKSKTCIIISHRPAALEICDKILHIADKKFSLQENI